MKNGLILMLFLVYSLTVFSQNEQVHDLEITVKDLRNSTGVVQFALGL